MDFKCQKWILSVCQMCFKGRGTTSIPSTDGWMSVCKKCLAIYLKHK
jgi:hypothetical protein